MSTQFSLALKNTNRKRIFFYRTIFTKLLATFDAETLFFRSNLRRSRFQCIAVRALNWRCIHSCLYTEANTHLPLSCSVCLLIICSMHRFDRSFRGKAFAVVWVNCAKNSDHYFPSSNFRCLDSLREISKLTTFLTAFHRFPKWKHSSERYVCLRHKKTWGCSCHSFRLREVFHLQGGERR